MIPRRRLIICANVIEILGQRPTGSNDINVEAEIALGELEKQTTSRNRETGVYNYSVYRSMQIGKT